MDEILFAMQTNPRPPSQLPLRQLHHTHAYHLKRVHRQVEDAGRSTASYYKRFTPDGKWLIGSSKDMRWLKGFRGEGGPLTVVGHSEGDASTGLSQPPPHQVAIIIGGRTGTQR